MAVTHNEIQVQWSGADSQSVSAGASATSDTVSFHTAAVEGMVSLKADNNGTPAAGDTVDLFILYTSGDPDGAGADEFDTNSHGRYLATLDTSVEDPALRTVRVGVAAKGAKIRAVNNSAGRSITVSAALTEVRG